jgi:hypothetical protein
MPQALYFLLLLACPLAMVFMMRAMHGGHGRSGAGDRHEPDDVSLNDLRERRSELDRQIAAREHAESLPADERR